MLVGVVVFITTNRPVELLGNAAPRGRGGADRACPGRPGVWRLVRHVTVERRERIRQEDRAEMAAHRHDSVLRTLALIQRTDDADEWPSLARVQERELRTWLYG